MLPGPADLDGAAAARVNSRSWHPRRPLAAPLAFRAPQGLRHVLTVIRCLLIEPNPDSALNDEAGA